MTLQHGGPAPYGPASGVMLVVDRARNGSLPNPVDSGVLERIGVSKSLLPRVAQSLRLLDLLTDDGAPTEPLDGLRMASTDDFKPPVAAWLQSVYGEVF